MVAGRQPMDDRISVEQREDREKNQAVGMLTISNLVTSDDGLYACIARNKVIENYDLYKFVHFSENYYYSLLKYKLKIC